MKRLYALAIALGFLLFGARALADTAHGTWVMTTEKGAVQLEMQWHDDRDGHQSSNDHSGNIDTRSLGIAGALASQGERASFSMHREAGDFAFEGWLGKGEGSGTYTFTPSDEFFSGLARRGYAVDSMDEKMAFADLDITNEYIGSIESLGYKPNVNNLIAMKALQITPQFVADMKTAGVSNLSAQQVISLKAVGVTPGYIGEIASAGYPHLDANQYITLRAMHVDQRYIAYLRAHGLKNLTVNQIVSMKATGI